MTTSVTIPADPPIQAPPAPGARRPPAAMGLVLGPAEREDLAEVVDGYPGRWVMVGPCAGGQWFAFPRHITVPFHPDAITRAELARLQQEHPS
jgi:hypothetical protein